ncbi:MAG: AAA family ATPase [Methylobacteriaceae bacterium]|jgi:protein phosphatase|nr:AAA family ATPase [Methylobacteriaceae bacterium]
MKVSIPDFSLVLLIGPSSAGKSSFARKHFRPTEVVSSDTCRGLVSDDETDQSASADAFQLVHTLVDLRLRRHRFTVVDATNLRREDRDRLRLIARKRYAPPVAIVFNPGDAIVRERNAARPDRRLAPEILDTHLSLLRQSLRELKREGFRRHIHVLDSVAEIDAVEIVRQSLPVDRRTDAGPFDIIGDIHGCLAELLALLATLGYRVQRAGTDAAPRFEVTPPAGRRVVFLGDLVDRGPDVRDVLSLVMDMVESGKALAVPGNHDAKLERWLSTGKAGMVNGFDHTAAEMNLSGDAFKARVRRFIGSLVSHYVLDGGRLVVSHAGIRESMIGRDSPRIRTFCLYGDVTGGLDDDGLPERRNWAADYRGRARIVYGHTPVRDARWHRNTLCLDTGCAFGGALTALRWPEMELVCEPARAVYCKPVRPLGEIPADAG